MSDTDPDIEILETDLPPPPAGTPLWFRELVALTLKTTDPTVLDAAEQDYRGVFASADDFIHNQLAEHLPAHLQWLPTCCDPAKLRAGYERGHIRLWTIGLPNGQVIVFESPREPGRRRPRA
ncbi:hypothetical protein [Nannocystis sp.]|uniref:hypothetical protein n=1 Tax=Nannocystis sp. TaxID=1962667 RepID=UPI0024222B0F|nr:hypothetical protein [Nannocystis sp.]MBK7829443.1 hypothetical protein [Nannocystis sp.]MBK9754638.1 hypothetical protein [Nannocystis sp.]